MSISSSLANAVSGLAAASRSAEVVSSNVANATTDGYGRREILLNSASKYTGGVRFTGIQRIVNQVAITDRRLADAEFGQQSQKSDFMSRLERTIGIPGSGTSLNDKITNFESSLLAASSSPQSDARLRAIFNTASDLSNRINEISDEIKLMREAADASISNQVNQVNTALQDVEKLNHDITRQMAVGGDVSSLMDQRQRQIDSISEVIPLREVLRDYGQVALVSTSGTILLDRKAAILSFDRTPRITPDMTLASNALSGITITGAGSSVGNDFDAIKGGSLAAAFDVRDALAVDAQSQIDAFTRNLIERVSDPSVDPTITAGNPGMFSDGGMAFDSLNEEGIAGRLSLNSAFDPHNGGELWRFRDGAGAVAPGAVGDASILTALNDAINEVTPTNSGNFDVDSSFSALAGEYLSQVSSAKQTAESRQSFAATKVSTMKDIEQRAGVSTDDEMQKLLLIEQVYAANARVIQTVDEMLQSLLRI